MKKLILTLTVVFLLFGYKAYCEVDFGVIAGVNSSSLKIEPAEDFDVEGRTTFGAGLFMNLQANDFLSLQVTPMYLQKGGNAKVDFDFLDYTEYRADYLEIPILIRLNFDAGMIKPYLLAGPSLGFQLNSTYLNSDGEEVDISNDTKNLDLSLVLGAGLEIELDNLSLFGQLTYNHGLSNLDNSDGILDFTDEIYTRSIGFYVGLSVPLGKK
jgi:opacity protein-like surface antigen